MTTFEYIAVLISIIVGLGIAHLLAGIGRLIGDARDTDPYWIHLVWTAYMFFTLVFFWWWEFKFNTLEVWTFELYLFIIMYAVVLYLAVVVLFPKELPEGGDFKRYFFDRRAWFYGLLVVTGVMDLIDTAAKGTEHLLTLGPEYWSYLALTTLLYLAAMRSTNERFHGVLAVGSLAYMLSWALRMYGTAV